MFTMTIYRGGHKMKRAIWKRFILTAVILSALVVFAGCQDNSAEKENNESNADEIDEIVGIEPGSGTMDIAENAVEGYDLDVDLTSSSEGAMLSTLDQAIEDEEPIVVTLWQPHWAFEKYDLKFLDDPEEQLVESENIHTMVRKGLEDDKPDAFKLLDNFHWDLEDMNQVMSEAQDDDVETIDAAKDWIKENQDKVDEWTKDIDPVDGETVELAYVDWETETASTSVVQLVLEDLGYDVELDMVDMGVAFQALSDGEVDGMLIAWLPVGAASYNEEYKDEIVDLGPNLEGAQQGFVVPEYMDIDSIDELPTE